jgi:hypothetical protein
MQTPTQYGLTAMLLFALPWATGCEGPRNENLSTAAAADPAKLQRAQAETALAASKAKAAEARKTRGAIKVETP